MAAQLIFRQRGEANPAFVLFGAVAFGCYLLSGAYYVFVEGIWPSFMPPQFDGLVFLSSSFLGFGGAYVVAFFMAAVGVVFLLLPVVAWLGRR